MQLSDPNDLAAHDLLVTLAHALANPFDPQHTDFVRCVTSRRTMTIGVSQGGRLEIKPMPNDEVMVQVTEPMSLGWLRIEKDPFQISYVHPLLLDAEGAGVELLHPAVAPISGLANQGEILRIRTELVEAYDDGSGHTLHWDEIPTIIAAFDASLKTEK